MVIYTGFPYVLYFHVQWRYQYETIPALKDQLYILKLIIFYHGYIYRISVCLVFACTVKILILNYTCTTRPSVYLEIDHSFIMVIYIQDFCMFCISKYSEGSNTKLHLHYKTKSTSFFILVMYTGFLYVLYFQVP